MNNENFIISFVADFVDKIINDPNGINQILVDIATYAVIFIWILFGLRFFLDFRKRFSPGIITALIVFVVSIASGLVGFIIYVILRPTYTKEEIEFFRLEHKFYHEQASKVVECVNCSHYVYSSNIHCTNCGTQNRFKCPNCDKYNSIKEKYCGHCGQNLKKFNQEKKIELRKLRKGIIDYSTQSNNSKLLEKNKEIEKDTSNESDIGFLVQFNNFIEQLISKSKDLLNSLNSKSKTSDKESNYDRNPIVEEALKNLSKNDEKESSNKNLEMNNVSTGTSTKATNKKSRDKIDTSNDDEISNKDESPSESPKASEKSEEDTYTQEVKDDEKFISEVNNSTHLDKPTESTKSRVSRVSTEPSESTVSRVSTEPSEPSEPTDSTETKNTNEEKVFEDNLNKDTTPQPLDEEQVKQESQTERNSSDETRQ